MTDRQRKPRLLTASAVRRQLTAIAYVLLMVAIVTGVIQLALLFLDIQHVTTLYLVPVVIASMQRGVTAAVVAAVAGVGASAFFFYPPIFDFRVSNPDQIIDLILFIVVAIVISQLSVVARAAKTREQAERLRDALIGSVSHELRTPLASIVGSTSVLAQSTLVSSDDRLASLVRVLHQEADRLNNDIENLIDATRISSEGIHPRLAWVDPEDIVNATLARKQQLSSGRSFSISIADDLPLIYVDSRMIETALGQLIENAIKYSAADAPVALSVRQHNAEIRFQVADLGAGFTGDEKAQIFDRFYRSARLASIVPGSGLGLWIARALVESCGGRVDAHSHGIGKGAEVLIALPVQAQPENEPADE